LFIVVAATATADADGAVRGVLMVGVVVSRGCFGVDAEVLFWVGI